MHACVCLLAGLGHLRKSCCAPKSSLNFLDFVRRGSALLSRVAVDTFDSSAGMRLIRPLRNTMRAECEAALHELGDLQQRQDGCAVVEAAAGCAVADGASSSIGDLMKSFVAMLQVARFPVYRLHHRIVRTPSHCSHTFTLFAQHRIVQRSARVVKCDASCSGRQMHHSRHSSARRRETGALPRLGRCSRCRCRCRC